MKILVWNVRGLGNHKMLQALRHEVRSVKPQIMFFCESKCSRDRGEKLKGELNFGEFFCVPSIGKKGGLILMWEEGIQAQVLSSSEGHIDVVIKDDKGWWRFTGFYGNPESHRREDSWELLERLSQASKLLWIVRGDFNKILTADEKQGGSERIQRQMDIFRAAIYSCNLIDLGFKGHKFTWRKSKNDPNSTRERIDRFFAPHDFIDKFGPIEVEHRIWHSSDHVPLAASLGLNTNGPAAKRKKRPIKLKVFI